MVTTVLGVCVGYLSDAWAIAAVIASVAAVYVATVGGTSRATPPGAVGMDVAAWFYGALGPAFAVAFAFKRRGGLDAVGFPSVTATTALAGALAGAAVFVAAVIATRHGALRPVWGRSLCMVAHLAMWVCAAAWLLAQDALGRTVW